LCTDHFGSSRHPAGRAIAGRAPQAGIDRPAIGADPLDQRFLVALAKDKPQTCLDACRARPAWQETPSSRLLI
jgi:hypothetical protein